MLKVLTEKGQGRAYLGQQIIPLLGQFGYKESIPELRRILATDCKDLARSLVPPEGIHWLAAQALCRLGDR